MITLLIILYVIISLLVARYTYWDAQYDSTWGVKNKCYQNGKKSLKYGFLFIPKWLMITGTLALIMYGFCWMFFGSIRWIFINMP